MRRRPQRLLMLLAAALVLAVAAPGCGEELGPERFPTASVSGMVVGSGRPIAGGWVEFQPAEGAVGNMRSARIDPDGTFRADRVAIGLNVVRLIDLPGMPPGAAAVLSNDPSIRRTIPENPAGPIRIDVVDELRRYQEAQAAKAQPAAREGEQRP